MRPQLHRLLRLGDLAPVWLCAAPISLGAPGEVSRSQGTLFPLLLSLHPARVAPLPCCGSETQAGRKQSKYHLAQWFSASGAVDSLPSTDVSEAGHGCSHPLPKHQSAAQSRSSPLSCAGWASGPERAGSSGQGDPIWQKGSNSRLGRAAQAPVAQGMNYRTAPSRQAPSHQAPPSLLHQEKLGF